MRPGIPIALALVSALLLVGPALGRQELGVDSAAAIGDPQGSPLSGETLEQRTEELSSLMRCPVCQGLSIADSPTLLAQAMKSEVRQLLAGGYTEEQIFEYFEQSYGEFVRLEPKAKGFNLVVWIAPAVALMLGMMVIALRLKKRAPAESSQRTEPPAQHEDLEGYRQRVRQEIGS